MHLVKLSSTAKFRNHPACGNKRMIGKIASSKRVAETTKCELLQVGQTLIETNANVNCCKPLRKLVPSNIGIRPLNATISRKTMIQIITPATWNHPSATNNANYTNFNTIEHRTVQPPKPQPPTSTKIYQTLVGINKIPLAHHLEKTQTARMALPLGLRHEIASRRQIA